MSYAKAKSVMSDIEMQRFICCFLNTKDILESVNWEAAAAQFDPKIKSASFKTVVQRSLKKLKGADDGNGDDEHEKGAVKGKGAKKRKPADDAEEVGEAEKPATKKGKGGRKPKKAAKAADAEEAEEGDEIVVKGENGDGNDSA